MQPNNYVLINNVESKQYEFHIDRFIPKIEYFKVQDHIFLTHTEVQIEIEGKGIGSELVRQTLEDINKQELTLVPLCPFVALYLKRHPEWNRLVYVI